MTKKHNFSSYTKQNSATYDHNSNHERQNVTTMSTKQDGSDCDPTNKALKKSNKYGCLQTNKINKKQRQPKD